MTVKRVVQQSSKGKEIPPLPSYATPFYKYLAIRGVIIGVSGFIFLAIFLVFEFTAPPINFGFGEAVLVGMFFLFSFLMLFFSWRWLLRYGRYIKLGDHPWWRKPKRADETPHGLKQ